MRLAFGIFHISAKWLLKKVLLNLFLADAAFHAPIEKSVLYKITPY